MASSNSLLLLAADGTSLPDRLVAAGLQLDPEPPAEAQPLVVCKNAPVMRSQLKSPPAHPFLGLRRHGPVLTPWSSRLGFGFPSVCCSPRTPTISASVKSFTLKVDTKYYSAKVAVCQCSDVKHAPATADAVILAVDASEDKALELARARWEALDGAQQAADTLLLVCFDGSGAAAVTAALAEQCETWSADNMFEFVPVKAEGGDDDDDREEGKASSGASAEEAAARRRAEGHVGLARVKEALEATMWGDMDMKTELRPHMPSVGLAAAAADVEAEAEVEVATSQPGGLARAEAAGSAGRLTGAEGSTGSTTDAAAAGTADSNADEVKEEEQKASSATAAAGAAALPDMAASLDDLASALMQDDRHGGGSGGAEDDDEHDLAGLEALMQRVQQVRSQANNLPDDQRKRLAADTALQLASLLGAGEDDDSD